MDKCVTCGNPTTGRVFCNTCRPQATAEEIAKARKLYGNTDDIEIDDDARASATDTGVWVQAWVWLDADDMDNNDD